MDVHFPQREFDTIWEPCGGCWGQRVIWTQSPGTGALSSEACASCLGVGQRAVVVQLPVPRNLHTA